MDQNSSPRTPLGSGCLVSASILTGVAMGLHYGQPSIGLVAGAGVGVVLALVAWLIDRRR